MSGVREDVPARLPVSALQHQRPAAVVQHGRRRCVRDGLRPAAPHPPAPGSHHPAGPYTGAHSVAEQTQHRSGALTRKPLKYKPVTKI